MAIGVMDLVWRHSQAQGEELLALLALADNANDEGIAFPSYAHLAMKTRRSQSHARRVIARLLETDELSKLSSGSWGESNRYVIELDALREKPQVLISGTPDPDVHSDVQPGVQQVNSEPSEEEPSAVEPSVQQKPVAEATTTHLPGLEPPEPESPRQKLWEDDEAIDAIWAHFLVTFPDTPQRQLSASRRRLIVKALKETVGDLDDAESRRQSLTYCKRAISGLKAWRRQKKGDETLSAVFATRPNGSVLGDQIEFFASQADDTPEMDPRIPSAMRGTVFDCRMQVIEMYRAPDSKATAERGKRALAWLRERAFEQPVVVAGEVTGWEPVDGPA